MLTKHLAQAPEYPLASMDSETRALALAQRARMQRLGISCKDQEIAWRVLNTGCLSMIVGGSSVLPFVIGAALHIFFGVLGGYWFGVMFSLPLATALISSWSALEHKIESNNPLTCFDGIPKKEP